MTITTAGPVRAGTIRRWGAVLAAPLLVVAAACGDDSDSGAFGGLGPSDDEGTTTTTVDSEDVVAPAGFEASPAFLQAAADQSTAESFAYELWVSFAEVDTSAPPLARGVEDGERYSMTMELEGLMLEMMAALGDGFGQTMTEEQFRAEFEGIDLTMDMMGDGSSLYLRMPFLDQVPPGELDDDGRQLADLGFGDRWGYVDLTATGLGMEDLQASMTEGLSFDTNGLIDLVANAADAEDLAPAEVRGELVSGITARVSVADLQAAYGETLDPEMADVYVPVGVWVDSDGYLRRLEFTMDLAEIMATMGEQGEFDDLSAAERAEMENIFGGIAYHVTVDLFDFGEPIDVDFPTDFVDITDSAHLLLED